MQYDVRRIEKLDRELEKINNQGFTEAVEFWRAYNAENVTWVEFSPTIKASFQNTRVVKLCAKKRLFSFSKVN